MGLGQRDEVCGGCRGRVTHTVGESLTGGENAWFLERLCEACGESSLAATGRGLVPAAVRERFLDLTGRWRVRVDQGSDEVGVAGGGVAGGEVAGDLVAGGEVAGGEVAGDLVAGGVVAGAEVSVPVLRVLRRVYGLSVDEARERRVEVVRDGLSGTCGEAAWIAAELAGLGVGSRVTLEVPGTQTELPERPMPTPPTRIGGAVGPVIVIEDEAERLRIADYMAKAHCLLAGGYWIDPITRDPRDRYGDAVMTDSVFTWSIAWATLLPLHGLPLSEDFVEHVRARGYEPLTFGGAGIGALLASIEVDPPEES